MVGMHFLGQALAPLPGPRLAQPPSRPSQGRHFQTSQQPGRIGMSAVQRLQQAPTKLPPVDDLEARQARARHFRLERKRISAKAQPHNTSCWAHQAFKGSTKAHLAIRQVRGTHDAPL